MPPRQTDGIRRALVMGALIVAGEVVFLLPFVVARIFRPTFLDVFGLTNFQLGSAFSLYGVVAMASYFAGGPLADRFSPRALMSAALLATAAGGVILATVPSLAVLTLLYGFWGLTTILLFWAALIRATREWGGPGRQGRAYGILDGGRGLVAALLASASVAVFAAMLPVDPATASLAERSAALSRVIVLFTGFIVIVAGLVWIAVPAEGATEERRAATRGLIPVGLRRVLGMRSVWLQAAIVVCAYVGYKATDDFSLLARDTFGYDDVQAARLGTVSFWVRPFAAVAAGLLADRFAASRVTAVSFVLLAAGSTIFAAGIIPGGVYWLLALTVIGTSLGIYALRGIYFALLGEARVPLAVTGSAVGVVSFIGYTPDVFMGPLMGWLLDRSPGALGHQHVFAVVSVFAVAGLLFTWAYRRTVRRQAARGG